MSTYSMSFNNHLNMSSQGNFHIIVNGKYHEVEPCNLSRSTTLNGFLREHLHLTGTKRMCLEGGCGTCVVSVKRKHNATGKNEIFAVNSCLIPIFSAHGWEISTIEGLGSWDNPHELQSTINKFYGTQCGYCTPGMIMNMFALKTSKGDDLTMAEVENSFGGNICRCTGYRPILAAFKSLCNNKSVDIEDLPSCPMKNNTNGNCNSKTTSPFFYDVSGISWIKVENVSDLLKILKTSNAIQNINTCSSICIVAGNTAQGVYKSKTAFKMYVDIQDVAELQNHLILKNGLVIGANMTLTKTIALFNELSEKRPKLKYLKKIANHIDLVANLPVRNVGTLAGNIMIKHKHKDFPSDIFLLLETINALLQIVDVNEKEVLITPMEFLKTDMENKIIKKIIFPFLTDCHFFDSFKVMRRAQNVHATINAAFLLKLTEGNIIEEANIVYGCLGSKIHACETESFLLGKNAFDNHVLQGAFASLHNELSPEFNLMRPKPEFLKKCAISLFYKFILSIAPEELISPKMMSGREKLHRPVSKGSQTYESVKEMYPLTYPKLKQEGLHQSTGEAEYISDMPDLPQQLHAAFVLAKCAPLSKITHVHKEKALKLEGVVAYLDETDIPGRNVSVPKELMFFPPSPADVELFCSGVVRYHGQPIGVVVATSRERAEEAADLIEVLYEPGDEEFFLETQEVLKHSKLDRIQQCGIIEATNKGNNVAKIINGTYDMGGQYHFYMETQVCNAVYKENGLDIWASTQWIDLCQNAAAVALNIPANMINVSVRRVGGSFGGKVNNNAIVSTATALAAYKLKKPVKMWLPIESNFALVGKRNAVHSDYEVAVDDEGRIQYLNNACYINHGENGNEDVIPLTLSIFHDCSYKNDVVSINVKTVTTDAHSTSYVRSPGSIEGLGMLENIIEHTASIINMDPLEFRLKNMTVEDPKVLGYMHEFLEWADIKNRKQEIKLFNEKNIWRKKGISVIPMIYSFELFLNYGVTVSIFHFDGSVAVSHGGVEIGQGVNTKAIQTCAYKLGIPMDKISVKPSNNVTSANSKMTAASMTSEGICWGVCNACDILLDRMKPIKEKLDNPSWETLVRESHKNLVNLVANSMYSPLAPGLEGYKVYAACAAEVELDVLTGLHQVSRVDILEDTGYSMNPEVDIGQIEGAFIMGLGYYVTEKLITGDNGEILTNRTWNYQPPGAKDIPIDFRIKLPGNNPNPVGVLKSKAVGEPAICLAITIPLAIRNAASSVRKFFDPSSSPWYSIDGPSDVENTFINCLHDYKKYSL